MVLLYRDQPIFLSEFEHQLGRVHRNLAQLKEENVLLSDVETLRAVGYWKNFGMGEDETLASLAKGPASRVMERAGAPDALVFQHCNAESAVLAYPPAERNIALRNRYFAAELMREVHLDHLPYFCSFASGCAGFMSMLTTAGGILTPASQNERLLCVMADYAPPGVPFDMIEERILGSDQTSAFLLTNEKRAYRLLGLNYYSTVRTKVPFVEIVKRSVQMIHELAQALGIDLAAAETAIHYPNIFPDTWRMVSRYLRLPKLESIIDDMEERAHCGATDSVISLGKHFRGSAGRIHLLINYGVGLHLGICVLEEQDV